MSRSAAMPGRRRRSDRSRRDAAADVVLRLLGAIAARGREARAADFLRTDGIGAFRSVVAGSIDVAPVLPSAAAGRADRPPSAAGWFAGARDRARIRPCPCERARAIARTLPPRHGVSALRPAPGRALLLLGVAQERAAALRTRGRAARLRGARRRSAPAHRGLSRQARLRVGIDRGARARAEIARQLPPSREIAAIHVSGCAKGCAHPARRRADRGRAEHGCGIVRDGSARATPRYHVDAADVVAEVVRIAAERERAPSMAEPAGLSARRRRDLPALVRHHPRRGRPVALLAPRRPRSRCA